MLYPMKFVPVYKEYIWGGNNLKQKFNRILPSEYTAESWEIACHSNGMSRVVNGPLAGLTLDKLFKYSKDEMMGEKSKDYDEFPLLIKIIDAEKRLSLQVHPNDEYAKNYENGQNGKDEVWYVIDAKENAKLVLGLKENVTKEMFLQAVKDETISEIINEIPVEAGDVINIPAGLLHAIEEGVIIAEVQQNSDLVYRVNDWNRVDENGESRELHIDKAIDVIDFDHKISKQKISGKVLELGKNMMTTLTENKHFVINKLDLLGSFNESTIDSGMLIYTCIKGGFVISWNDKLLEVSVGESLLIPMCVNDYKLFGEAGILRVTLPN